MNRTLLERSSFLGDMNEAMFTHGRIILANLAAF